MSTLIGGLLVVLALVAEPLYAQDNGINQVNAIHLVTLSGSLIACGYTKQGGELGLATAEKVFPVVGLSDKSDKVTAALLKGQAAIKDGTVTCADVADYAKQAGITGM